MVHSGEPKCCDAPSPSEAMAETSINSPGIKWCVKCLTYHDPAFNCLCAGTEEQRHTQIIDYLRDIKRLLTEIEYNTRTR